MNKKPSPFRFQENPYIQTSRDILLYYNNTYVEYGGKSYKVFGTTYEEYGDVETVDPSATEFYIAIKRPPSTRLYLYYNGVLPFNPIVMGPTWFNVGPEIFYLEYTPRGPEQHCYLKSMNDSEYILFDRFFEPQPFKHTLIDAAINFNRPFPTEREKAMFENNNDVVLTNSYSIVNGNIYFKRRQVASLRNGVIHSVQQRPVVLQRIANFLEVELDVINR